MLDRRLRPCFSKRLGGHKGEIEKWWPVIKAAGIKAQ
jgi:hypothetical protein